MAATGLATKKATVEEALRRLVRRRERLDALVDMAGLGWEGDLAAMQEGAADDRRRQPGLGDNPMTTNGEIKRRTNVVGIFPNEEAITRLVGAILMEQNDEWAVQQARYMTLETIASMSNTQTATLARDRENDLVPTPRPRTQSYFRHRALPRRQP